MSTPTIEDPRGFHFTVPEGFSAFPGFEPTATKLYAYGKNLGTPGAITLTIDLLEGATTPGSASRSCGALMNSIERTVGTPITEKWGGSELSGLRMLMTHVFGEVTVFCVDVPITPKAISLMVSGKPANTVTLQDTFRSVLSSMGGGKASSNVFPLALGAVILIAALALLVKRRRRSQ